MPDTDTTADDIGAGFREFKQQHGIDAAAILSKGQYEYPGGFFYGGNARAWSNELLERIAETHLANAEDIYDIDIHTGLGKFGEAEYIVECSPDSDQYRISRAIWGDGLRSTTTGASRSPNVSGSVMSGLQAILGGRLAGMGLEFGTVPTKQVMAALIADRWLHYHGKRNSNQGEEIRAGMRAAFYPDKADWRAAVTATARLVVQQALDYAAR
jgi:hypothetical protein